MLTAKTVREYVAVLAAKEPTPGGGSAAALVGALGVALGEMAANFTRDKENWDKIAAPLQRLESYRNTLLELIEADAEAYAHVSAAYVMPRATEEEKAARREAIQAALKIAAKAPLQAVETIVAAIEELRTLAEYANPNLISDVGVAAIFTYAALKGAWLNVEINLVSIKDEAYVAQIRRMWQERIAEAEKKALEVWENVCQRICG